MARITGSHLVCKALQLEGVKNIFGLAGDHILPLLDVMADRDFRIIDTRHEQAAVHMADAWSRIYRAAGSLHVHDAGLRQRDSRPHQRDAYRGDRSFRSPAAPTRTTWVAARQQEIDQVAMAAPISQRLVHGS